MSEPRRGNPFQYDARTRAKLAEAGFYQSRSGQLEIAAMPAGHLINALLRCLEQGDPEGVTAPLAAEVDRRGLAEAALARAAARIV